MRHCIALALILLVHAMQAEAGGLTSRAVELIPDSLRDTLFSCLEDAGENAGELEEALKAAPPELRNDLVWLILTMEHLDRLEIGKGTLLEHLVYADSSRVAFKYSVPQELFREYILAFRISTEPASPYKKELFDYFRQRTCRSRTPEEAAMYVNRWLRKNVKTAARGVLGPTQSPLLTFRSRRGTEEEIAILAAAILRSLGIPSRPVILRYCGAEAGGKWWLEVHGHEGWVPMYPLRPDRFGDFSFPEEKGANNITHLVSLEGSRSVNVTSRYTDTGRLRIRFRDRGSTLESFEHASVEVWNDGALRALDDLEWAEAGEGGVSCELGVGDYVVVVGARDRTGSVFVRMREVSVTPGETVLDMEVSPEAYVEPAREGGPEEPESLAFFSLPGLGGSMRSLPEFISDRPTVFILFDPRSEPSVRSLSMLDACFGRSEKEAPLLVGISEGDAEPGELTALVEDLGLSFPVLMDAQALLSARYGVKSSLGLPLIFLVGPDGTIRLFLSGKDASACARIRLALPGPAGTEE